jgi:signal peptidase I
MGRSSTACESKTRSRDAHRPPNAFLKNSPWIGDHVIANNLAYGFQVESLGVDLRWADPERDDVVIFPYPVPGPDQGTMYVKRVVGLPGERVRLEDNVLVVNGTRLAVTAAEHGVSCKDGVPDRIHCDTQVEQLGRHSVVTQHQDAPSCALRGACDSTWPARTRPQCFGLSPCLYFGAGDTNPDWPDVVLPADSYLVMGDNRDNSSDGRYWGLVPRSDIKSEAVLVW